MVSATRPKSEEETRLKKRQIEEQPLHGFRLMRLALPFRWSLAGTLLAVLVCLHPPRSAYADAAPKWTDADLIGFSDVVVRGRVARIGVARGLRRAIADGHSVDAGQIDATPREAHDAVAIASGKSGVGRTLSGPPASAIVRVDLVAGSQTGWPIDSERHIRRAADFWTTVGSIELATGGLSSPGCLFSRRADGRIVVGADNCGELSPRGGTLALSGGWVTYADGGGETSPGGSYVAAGVITNLGPVAARLVSDERCFERLAMHELGHAIGVGHSPDTTAVMGSLLRCDGRFGTMTSLTERGDWPRAWAMTTAPVSTQATSSAAQPPAAAAAPTFELVSVATDGTQANGPSRHPVLSADARFVAFESDATNLVPGDTNGVTDIFVHDRLTGLTTRESIGRGGVQGTGASFEPQISANGRYVAFVSCRTRPISLARVGPRCMCATAKPR